MFELVALREVEPQHILIGVANASGGIGGTGHAIALRQDEHGILYVYDFGRRYSWADYMHRRQSGGDISRISFLAIICLLDDVPIVNHAITHGTKAFPVSM